MPWTIRFIAACCLGVSMAFAVAEAAENCTACHLGIVRQGAHASLTCLACHLKESGTVGNPAAVENRAAGCVTCHRGHERIFDHAVDIRTGNKRFVPGSLARLDSGPVKKECNSCHIQGCLDCHGEGHAITKPAVGKWKTALNCCRNTSRP